MQTTQISQIFEKLALLDRLKKWEPVKQKNKLAYFSGPVLPISTKAQPWEHRVAEFQSILPMHPYYPVNPV